MKLSDVARKPSDILSYPSGIEVDSLSDRTITLSEVNVQRFYHHSVPVARKIFPVSRKTVNFFLRAEMQFTIRLAMLPNLGNRVYQSAVIVLILICVHTYFRAKLTSKSSDIIIHFVRPKLKGIGHFVRRLCKKYFKVCNRQPIISIMSSLFGKL